jgi:type II restriction enzyme
VKLGRWDEYLAMRDGIRRLNDEHRALLSNDLGAVAGLLFDVGSGRFAPPPSPDDYTARARWEADLAHVRGQNERARRAEVARGEGDRSHTEIQGWLRDLGCALGFDVFIERLD